MNSKCIDSISGRSRTRSLRVRQKCLYSRKKNKIVPFSFSCKNQRRLFFRTELARIDTELLDPVLDDPLGRPQQLCRPGLVAVGLPQGSHDELSFLGLDDGIELALPLSFVVSNQGLEGGGQMDRLDGVPGSKEDRPLHTILQFPDIAGPMVRQQDV